MGILDTLTGKKKEAEEEKKVPFDVVLYLKKNKVPDAEVIEYMKKQG